MKLKEHTEQLNRSSRDWINYDGHLYVSISAKTKILLAFCYMSMMRMMLALFKCKFHNFLYNSADYSTSSLLDQFEFSYSIPEKLEGLEDAPTLLCYAGNVI